MAEIDIEGLINTFEGKLTPEHIELALEYLVTRGIAVYGKTDHMTTIGHADVMMALTTIVA